MFIFTDIRKRDYTAATFDALRRTFAWSANHLMVGLTPSWGLKGSQLLAGRLKVGAAASVK